MTRPVFWLRSVAALGLALAVTIGATPARAESAEQPAAEPTPPASYSLRGFDVLASAGWGTSTAKIGDLEIAPYGATFGIDAGYTWPVGFRLAAHFDAALGRGVVQSQDPRIGREFEFTADTSSLNGGFSMGWDVPLYCLLLRYTVRLGVTSMSWDFGETPPRTAYFDDESNPIVGLHVAPGMALLWPHRWFEAGIGFDYLAQAHYSIPSGFMGKVMIGVRP